MKTSILKPTELKAASLGVGLSIGYLVLTILITVFCKTEYSKDSTQSKKYPAGQDHRRAQLMCP